MLCSSFVIANGDFLLSEFTNMQNSIKNFNHQINEIDALKSLFEAYICCVITLQIHLLHLFYVIIFLMYPVHKLCKWCISF